MEIIETLSGTLLIESITGVLKTTFPAHERYIEYQDQALSRPCFLVEQILMSQEKHMNTRYRRNYRFRITWLPTLDEPFPKEACLDMGENLLGVLRLLPLAETVIRPSDMSLEVVNGELQFTIDYSINALWSSTEEPSMKHLEESGTIKV